MYSQQLNERMKPCIFSLLLLLWLQPAVSQPTFAFTTAASRAQHDWRLTDTVINNTFRTPLSADNENGWRSAFWAMELLLYKSPFTKAKLQEAWNKANDLTEGFQKALLEVSYTLYPTAFTPEVTKLLQITPSPAVFIRSAEYLLQAKPCKATHNSIKHQLAQRFNGSAFRGFALLQQRMNDKPTAKRPPLTNLLSKDFLPGQTIIYSLQRSNRNYPGLVIIRRGDGSWVRNSDGSLFYTTQLARSITNYPFYITNGNTPQGIFRWTGFDTSSIAYIGPTPNLQMVMPVEVTPAVFFDDSSLANVWTKELYASLLPPSWKTDIGIYESWWAGEMGRSEIIMHGTTIDPRYYKAQPYYPQTPSLGCLCSYEAWNSYGQRVNSNQQKLVDALTGIGSTQGYVVVINVDDQPKPVSQADLAQLINH